MSFMYDPKMNFCMKSNHLSHWSLLSIQSQWFEINNEEAVSFSCTCVFTGFFSKISMEILGYPNINFFIENWWKQHKWKQKFQPHCAGPRQQTPRHIGIIYNCNLLGDFEFDLDNIYQKSNMIVKFYDINIALDIFPTPILVLPHTVKSRVLTRLV